MEEYDNSAEETCALCKADHGAHRRSPHHAGAATMVAKLVWKGTCCYDETVRVATELDNLKYTDASRKGNGGKKWLDEELPRDVQALRLASMVHNAALHELKRRLEEAELRIQVLLDMKRMGEIDAKNPCLKRQRRGSV